MSWFDRALRLGDRCPPGWKLTRAASDPAAGEDVRAHVEVCARCSAEIESLRQLSAYAADLPQPTEMSPESRQAISARLLTSAAPTPVRSPRARFLIAGVAVAAIAGVAGVVPTLLAVSHPTRSSGSPRETPSPTSGAVRSWAAIRAIGGARYARVQSRPDDVVKLDEGTIVLEVAPLPAGERFRLRTNDAEVEVRGTRFQVSAAGGELLAVSVSKGRVEVRTRGGATALLEAGDEWVRGPVEPPSASAPLPSSDGGATAPARLATETGAEAHVGGPARTAPPPARPATESRRASADPTHEGKVPAARVSFDRAWALLRQGNPRQAADLFGEVERLSPEHGIAEDALYWRAVAVARTGDSSLARHLFNEFLARFPGSSRGGEAATALGWLLLENGDREAARRAFERASLDPSPTVRAGALEGIRGTAGH